LNFAYITNLSIPGEYITLELLTSLDEKTNIQKFSESALAYDK